MLIFASLCFYVFANIKPSAWKFRPPLCEVMSSTFLSLTDGYPFAFCVAHCDLADCQSTQSPSGFNDLWLRFSNDILDLYLFICFTNLTMLGVSVSFFTKVCQVLCWHNWRACPALVIALAQCGGFFWGYFLQAQFGNFCFGNSHLMLPLRSPIFWGGHTSSVWPPFFWVFF